MKPSLPWRLCTVVACTLAGAAWLVYQGPIPVIRITTPLPETAPFWYMLLAFPILGLLLADLLDLFRAEGFGPSTLELGGQIGLIILLSSARLGARIPLSGHALLVSYFIFRRLFLRSHGQPRFLVEMLLACATLAAIAYPKLAWWRDPVTLGVGGAVGALLALFSRWFGEARLRQNRIF